MDNRSKGNNQHKVDRQKEVITEFLPAFWMRAAVDGDLDSTFQCVRNLFGMYLFAPSPQAHTTTISVFQSACVTICLSISSFFCLWVRLSVCPVCQSMCLSVCLFIGLSVCFFLSLCPVCQSLCLSVYMSGLLFFSVHRSIFQSIGMFVSLSVCFSVCLYVF